ncbi:helix-turn-helix domain-containing protein [Salisediminibacterium beveridgei]|uniref:Putative HTH-type transcriptional regulator yisR n=1 Tax=Salisediminibacterium beveridgei TaxID=632773 RepID=A0A1D7QWN3_9BACI|nr:AraC family transcriptional regulator [Salisediminibacterium beveridgei]AOM83413.1 putative HTH-type transcriptional regulator yisR [Salisediminibacterium beveridgei]AOM83427.1 Transcriptional regulator, AraC family [Salisediminibacterium beveridgei]
MNYITSDIPPIPVFIKGNYGLFREGTVHFKRQFDVFDLIYVFSGTLYMKENDQILTIHAGEYAILTPGKTHEGVKPCEEDTHIAWIHFEFPLSFSVTGESLSGWSDILTSAATYTEPERYQLRLPVHSQVTIREVFESKLSDLFERNESSDVAVRMRQQTLFFDVLLELQQQVITLPSAAQEVAEQSIVFIRQHYKDNQLSVKKMASILLFHPDYISRSIKKVTGLTAVQYMNQVRINHAKRLLHEGIHDLSTVSVACGFSDSAYFSRVFKRSEGISPGQYRRMNRVSP